MDVIPRRSLRARRSFQRKGCAVERTDGDNESCCSSCVGGMRDWWCGGPAAARQTQCALSCRGCACRARSCRSSLPLADAFPRTDDLRPELGAYNQSHMSTPNLDALAARSMVFERAYVQQAVCGASRNSFMTGRYPDATRSYNFIDHVSSVAPVASRDRRLRLRCCSSARSASATSGPPCRSCSSARATSPAAPASCTCLSLIPFARICDTVTRSVVVSVQIPSESSARLRRQQLVE